jgi:hypothetical protein
MKRQGQTTMAPGRGVGPQAAQRCDSGIRRCSPTRVKNAREEDRGSGIVFRIQACSFWWGHTVCAGVKEPPAAVETWQRARASGSAHTAKRSGGGGQKTSRADGLPRCIVETRYSAGTARRAAAWGHGGTPRQPPRRASAPRPFLPSRGSASVWLASPGDKGMSLNLCWRCGDPKKSSVDI